MLEWDGMLGRNFVAPARGAAVRLPRPIGRLRGAASALRTSAAVAATVAVAVLFTAAPAAAASSVPPPSSDPFYTYAGSLVGIAPGTVLKERTVRLVLAERTSTPVQAVQLLFRTTNELGGPALAVTTVIRPLTGPLVPRIVSWQPFYDSLGSQCDPSYDLRGGESPDGCNGSGRDEGTAASTFLAQGATVVITDYEETNQVFGAGRLEGYATLDGIRAAESYLRYVSTTTPVAMIGYSGGAIASQWAAELAPAYAPKLDIVGTAAGGVFVDPVHNLYYINGGATGWASVIPVFLIVLQRAYGVNLTPYLSPLGAKVISQDQSAYIGNLASGFTTYQQLLKPQYQTFTSIPGAASALNQLIMGSDGTPKSPMFLENGAGIENNGYDGDGIMITADIEALAHTYCTRGVAIEFQQYNYSHTEAAVPFYANALPWLTARLAGLPAPSNCSTIGPGSSLAPLPTASPPTSTKHRTRRRLQVTARPRSVRAGRFVRFRFVVSGPGSGPLRGALARFDGRQGRTNRHGVFAIRLRVRRPGLYNVRASAPGYRAGRAAVRVRPRHPRASRRHEW